MTDEAKLKPHDREEEISGEWKHDNQQWWNWYMTLAENEHDQNGRRLKKTTHRNTSGHYQKWLICRPNLTLPTN